MTDQSMIRQAYERAEKARETNDRTAWCEATFALADLVNEHGYAKMADEELVVAIAPEVISPDDQLALFRLGDTIPCNFRQWAVEFFANHPSCWDWREAADHVRQLGKAEHDRSQPQ